MLDSYGRKIEYLRLSVTDRCDLCCIYCKPDKCAKKTALPSADALVNICSAAAGLGIKYVRITGGEPLTRPDCPELIRRIKAIDGIEGVYLTTNGTTLAKYAAELHKAGIDGINVSLDTADREEYRRITGFDRLADVEKGIDECLRLGIPLKLNCVTGRHTTEKGIAGLLRYPTENSIALRFIELMPIGGQKAFDAGVQKRLISSLRLVPDSYRSRGPAVYYTSPQLKGRIGFISAVSHSFCSGCNRLRVTHDLTLKPCLCYGSDISLRGIENDLQSLKQAFCRAAAEKPLSHCFNTGDTITEYHTMDKIGG